MVSTTASLLFRFVIATSLVVPATVAPHTPHLTRAEVRAVARHAAENAGFKLKEFGEPRIEYEFTRKNLEWTIFFERKTVHFGGDFLVWVNDRTKQTKVMPGE